MKSIYEKERFIKEAMYEHHHLSNQALAVFIEICSFRQSLMENHIDLISEVILRQMDSKVIEKAPTGRHRFEILLHHDKQLGDARNALVNQLVRHNLFFDEDGALRKIKNITLCGVDERFPEKTNYTFSCNLE